MVSADERRESEKLAARLRSPWSPPPLFIIIFYFIQIRIRI
jgi:hypothetical protein